MVILENIDIDIDKEILKNIDIDIDKEISENIDIDKISNRLEFGISNRATYPLVNDTANSLPIMFNYCLNLRWTHKIL